MLAVVALEEIGADSNHRAAVDFSRASSGRPAPAHSAVATHQLRRTLRYHDCPRPWVARITARDPRFGFVREFLDGQRDYADAMSSLVRDCYLAGWPDEKIEAELGMDRDEVVRLKQLTGLAALFRDREFSQAWEACEPGADDETTAGEPAP